MSNPYEYVTDLFHKIREDIAQLKHKLFIDKPKLESTKKPPEYSIDAIHINSESSEESKPPQEPVIYARLNLPKTISVTAETEEKTKPWKQDKNFILQLAAVGVGGLVAIIYGCQLHQMIKANKISHDSFTSTQRSYVTIGRKDGTVAEFISPKDVRQNAQLILYFQNGGHIPAKIAWGTSPIELLGSDIKASGLNYTHPFKGMSRTKAKDGSVAWHGESTIIAGDSVFRAVLGEIPQDRIGELSITHASFAIIGLYQYCDELGTDITRQFTISYENAPDNTLYFKLTGDIDFPSPHVSTKDAQYLPPCESGENTSQ